MDWIKRNLGFVIGTVVALALLGAAGWYFYSAWKGNNETLAELHKKYANLDDLNRMKPHPGRPAQGTDNIKIAKDQQLQLKDFREQARKTFLPIPSIPEGPKVTAEDIVSALPHTIDRLQKAATNASVSLPSDYSFSFATQRHQMRFGSNVLDALAVQLGEVKAICDILFKAKVNTLEYIHRERITPEDSSGAADYTNQKSVTNEMAVLTPYEIKFKCFTPELASALSGFASSPHGLLVKTINVELAPAAEVAPDMTSIPTTPFYPAPTPAYPSAEPRMSKDAMSDRFRARYGLARGVPQPVPQPAAPALPAAGPAAKTGLQTVLDEKQLVVTLVLNVVKMLPNPKSS